MGNQQETISEFELGWLAGILDGEGTISINRLMSHRKNATLTSRISIGNTNFTIIRNLKRIFKKLKIKLFIQKNQRVKGKNWKSAYIIQISHIKGVKSLLDVITPYLIGKKLQAEIVLSFVNSRMKIYDRLGRVPGKGGTGTPYTKEEISLWKKARKLNKKGL